MMPGMETIRLERDEELAGLATLTLARPEKLNAINFTMHEEIVAACDELQRDPGVRVVIVTGEGRAFSAGADVGRRTADGRPARPAVGSGRDPLEDRYQVGAGNRSCAALEGLDAVTIGAVNGLAIGGAVAFLACLDIRLAAESAWFSIPEVDLGIPLTWNTLPRLMREIGPARTRELVMTCDRFTAAQAHEWGLVNHLHADAELLPAARALAARLLEKDALALALTKSTTRALANQMVPLDTTHSDREYLLINRAFR